MKDHPILFSGPMVHAILEGRKTQTRRVLKPQPRGHEYCGCGPAREYLGPKIAGKWGAYFPDFVPCKYGPPGDRLWVKETWAPHADLPGHAIYRADPGGDYQDNVTEGFKWRSARFMPRWASRITLLVTSVRVERLQDISWADAITEGVYHDGTWYRGGVHPVKGTDKCWPSAVRAYQGLWESINGPGSWDANPWVWVIEFKRVEAQPANV